MDYLVRHEQREGSERSKHDELYHFSRVVLFEVEYLIGDSHQRQPAATVDLTSFTISAERHCLRRSTSLATTKRRLAATTNSTSFTILQRGLPRMEYLIKFAQLTGGQRPNTNKLYRFSGGVLFEVEYLVGSDRLKGH